MLVYLWQIGVEESECSAKLLSKDIFVPIQKAYLIWYKSYNQFSKPERRFRNFNADVKVKVTGLHFLFWYAWKGLVSRHVCAKYKRCP